MGAQETMKIRAYPIIQRAVEEGILYGIRRLFKYNDAPYDETRLRDSADVLEDAIMDKLSEVIDFSDEEQLDA